MALDATDNAWPHPELVTISIVPDGVRLGGTPSNLVSTFNDKFHEPMTWLSQILSAAQYWAAQTDLNFQLVLDSLTPPQTGNFVQGDPLVGDIRIGGYNFGTSELARAYFPPPINNYGIAGDIQFNTGQVFNIGYDFDLFTVAVHEFGHALGLDHSVDPGAAMFGTYMGRKPDGVNADDIRWIRSIYSHGQSRSYDSLGGANNSFASAADVTWLTDPVRKTTTVSGRDITIPSQQSFYRIVAPEGTNGTMTVKVHSATLSFLSPVLTVYDGAQQALGSDGWSDRCNTVLSVTVPNVTPGQVFYVRVTGADSSVFSTGAYALTFAFGTAPPWPFVVPDTRTPNGYPRRGGGFLPETSSAPSQVEDESNDTFPVSTAVGDPASGATEAVSTAVAGLLITSSPVPVSRGGIEQQLALRTNVQQPIALQVASAVEATAIFANIRSYIAMRQESLQDDRLDLCSLVLPSVSRTSRDSVCAALFGNATGNSPALWWRSESADCFSAGVLPTASRWSRAAAEPGTIDGGFGGRLDPLAVSVLFALALGAHGPLHERSWQRFRLERM